MKPIGVVVQLDVGTNFDRLEESPFMLRALAQYAHEKAPDAEALEITRFGGLIARIELAD
jgi:hypothetical protein